MTTADLGVELEIPTLNGRIKLNNRATGDRVVKVQVAKPVNLAIRQKPLLPAFNFSLAPDSVQPRPRYPQLAGECEEILLRHEVLAKPAD